MWVACQHFHEDRISFYHGWWCKYRADYLENNMQLYKRYIWKACCFTWRSSAQFINRVYGGRVHNIWIWEGGGYWKVSRWILVLAGWLYYRLTRITTNKWVFLPLFSASPPLVAPSASPFFVELRSPPNTKYIRHLSSPGLKGAANEHISAIS